MTRRAPHVSLISAACALLFCCATTNTDSGGYASAKMSPRTPVEAGSLNVRSQMQLIVEVTTPSKVWAR